MMVYAAIVSTAVVLAALAPSICAAPSDNCVNSFSEFKKATIAENDGNVDALVQAFYTANSVFPLSVQVIYCVNSSNGTDIIGSTDPDCPPGEEMWLWVPSPIFIFMIPSRLNLYALFTLNYFNNWQPPRAYISVPDICNKSLNYFNFLNDLTMRVQMYAAAQVSSERGYLGYVLRGCHYNDPLKAIYSVTLPNENKQLEVKTSSMLGVYAVGNFFLIALVILVSVLFLRKQGFTLATSHCDNSTKSSFSNYGIFWGCVTVSAMGNVLLTAHTISLETEHLASGVHVNLKAGWTVLAQLVFGTLISLIVAIYYGRKFNFGIPSIFLLPFAILCCNHAREMSKRIVRCLAVWNLLLFLLHICCRASFIFLALLGRPPTVISTTLLYTFAVFYSVHLLAIFFTFAKAKKQQQLKAKITSAILKLGHVLVFLVLFATAVCFGVLIGFAGVLANYRTVVNSPYSTVSALIAPTFFLVFGCALRKVGIQWLETVTSPDEDEASEHLLKPLLQEVNLKDSAKLNMNVDGGQLVRGRSSTLMSWLMQ